MARHRGAYKKDHPEPYEVSRSQIQSFLKCPPHANTGFGPKGDKPCEYSVLFKGMLEHDLL